MSQKIVPSAEDKLVFLRHYRPQSQLYRAIKIKCGLGLRNSRLPGSKEAYSFVLLQMMVVFPIIKLH